MKFIDRADAGEKLAEKLLTYKDRDCIVYALPRGGIIPAAVVAHRLGAPLDVIISRKIGHPYHPEYAVAAVTENGTVVSNPQELGDLDEEWLSAEMERQQLAAKRWRKAYLQGRSPPSPKGKIAIVVDDGIATGLTMKAAVKELRQKEPAKIIVAIPVAPKSAVDELWKDVDGVVGLVIPKQFAGSVGRYYRYFEQIEDGDIVALLQEA